MGTTAPISATATGSGITRALVGMAWSLPSGDAFALSRNDFEVFGSPGSWTIRFCFGPAAAGLRITVLGDVPTFQVQAAETSMIYQSKFRILNF